MNEQEALQQLIEARIAELWKYRAWWRAHRWADWPDVRREADVELRALIRIARQARRKAQTTRRDLARGDFYAYNRGQ
jgi:hypothetical protein